MTEAWAFIATKQAYDSLGKMASYIRANNPDVNDVQALNLAVLAATYFQPVTDDDFLTTKMKEWGNALTDPDKFQALQDEREHKRNAPIERAYRQHLNDIRRKDLRRHLGPDAPDRRQLPTDKAVQVGRDLLDHIQHRRQRRRKQERMDEYNEQSSQEAREQASQPVEVDSEGNATMPKREF